MNFAFTTTVAKYYASTTATAAVPRQPAIKAKRYVKPKSPLVAFFWQKSLCFESTFALTMMERWEKVLIRASMTLFFLAIKKWTNHSHLFWDASRCGMGWTVVSLCAIMTTLLAIALVSYLPHHISFLRQRASFYLSDRTYRRLHSLQRLEGSGGCLDDVEGVSYEGRGGTFLWYVGKYFSLFSSGAHSILCLTEDYFRTFLTD